MKERPILFSTPMVKAILEGNKTQTRRPISPQPIFVSKDGNPYASKTITIINDAGHLEEINKHPETGRNIVKDIGWKYGVAGDRLWVRERWATDPCYNHVRPSDLLGHRPIYHGTQLIENYHKLRPSIHMPRFASRITLEIVSSRVERLQDITEEDARAEGIKDGGCTNCGENEPCGCDNPKPDARDAFAYEWIQIYGEGTKENEPHGWHVNPFVWVIEFRRVDA